jgi:hypothetical protein
MKHGLILACIASSLYLCQSAHSSKIYDVAEGAMPCIAADSKGKLCLVYEGRGQDSAPHIFYAESNDRGKTWTSPVDIAKTVRMSSKPRISLEDGGAVDVVWIDAPSDEKGPDVFFARSQDDGKSWSQAVDVSNTPGVSSEPVVAAAPDHSIHIAWMDTSSGETHPDIFYSLSNDGGKTWTKAEDISNTPNVSSAPAISIGTDGIVHLAWQDTAKGMTRPDILYERKVNGAWEKAVDVTSDCCATPGRPYVTAYPAIACDSKGKVYLAWVDNRKKEHAQDIWCRVAGKQGQFEKAINVSDTPGVSSRPDLAAGSRGRVAIVWADTTSGATHPDIFARIGISGGFSNVLNVTQTAGISRNPKVALTDNTISVVWEEGEGEKSKIKVTSVGLSVPTGPATEVEPLFHPHSR